MKNIFLTTLFTFTESNGVFGIDSRFKSYFGGVVTGGSNNEGGRSIGEYYETISDGIGPQRPGGLGIVPIDDYYGK